MRAYLMVLGRSAVHQFCRYWRQSKMPLRDYHGGDTDVVYSEHDSKRKLEVFELQLFAMRCMGQLPIPLDLYLSPIWQPLGRVFSKLYSGICVASHCHMAVLFLKTTYDMLQHGELEEITDALTMAIIFSFSTFATCYWLWNSQRLLDFAEEVNARYRHHSMAGLTFVSAKESIGLAHKISKYWLMACALGVTSWGLAPLFLRSHVLPLKCWYPFDPLQTVVYEIIYSIQLWCQFQMGLIFGNGSAIFVSIALVMLGQFDVLYCSLKNVDFHAEMMLGKGLGDLRNIQEKLPRVKDDELNQYAFSSEHWVNLSELSVSKVKPRASLKEALHDSLLECVHIHKFVLKSCNTLEELFNPYCLVKSLQITLQLCLLAFVGVAGERSMLRTINLLQYLALTLLELMMFTYSGELLRNHSVRAGEAFWRSQWWMNGHLIKQDILIFLVNSKRVVRVTAGKFYLMDIQRLRSVITQAFSFLTLLQKLAEKNN